MALAMESARPRARSSRLSTLLVAAVSALAAIGALLSISAVVAAAPTEAAHQTGESVKTSFGVVAVEFANVFSHRPVRLEGVDTLVMSAGRSARNDLHADRRPELY